MLNIYRNTSKGNEVVKYVPSCGLNGAGIISFFGCNLMCPFCFAQKYCYPDTKLGVNLDVERRMALESSQLILKISEFIDAHPNICYLQLTGGEPMFLKKNWSPAFKEIYHDMAVRMGFEKMVCETINAEGDGSKYNYLQCSIPALARCTMHSCIQSRIKDSKAIKRVNQTFGIEVPTNLRLQTTYNEFRGLFEPMGKPAHCYCGRNEFPVESRKSCPNICPWIP